MPTPPKTRAPRLGALLAVSVAALAALVAAGCSGDVSPVQNDDTYALGKAAARQKPWVPTPDEPVTLSIDVPPTARYGDPVPIRMTLHNGTKRPIAVGFGQTQGFDLLVAQLGMSPDSGGVWSPPKAPSLSRDAVIVDPLRPGRDTTFDIVWPGTDDVGHIVPRGRYRIRGRVLAELLKTKQLWTPWMPIDIK